MDYLTVKEAAERLGVKPATIYKLLSEEQLRHLRVGAKKVIPADAVDEFIETHTHGMVR